MGLVLKDWMRPFFHLSYLSPNTHYKHHCIKRDISCVSEEWIKKGRQCTYKRNIEACSSNNSCPRKAISITYSECPSVTIVIHHAMCMRRIILTSVPCLALQFSSTFSHKRHGFRTKKNVTEYNTCVLIVCTTCVCKISQWHIIINIH
jgi:hypothetical protein